MPTLTSTLSRHVDSLVQARGRNYFRDRRVTVLLDDGDYVEARVRGSREYQCVWWFNGDAAQVTCDCPYVASNGTVCKHLWAVALAIDANRSAASARRPGRIQVKLVDAESDGESDHDRRDAGRERSTRALAQFAELFEEARLESADDPAADDEADHDRDGPDEDEDADDVAGDLGLEPEKTPVRPRAPREPRHSPVSWTPKVLRTSSGSWWREIASRSRKDSPSPGSEPAKQQVAHLFLLAVERAGGSAKAELDVLTVTHAVRRIRKDGTPGACKPARRSATREPGPGREAALTLYELLDGATPQRHPHDYGFSYGFDDGYDYRSYERASWRLSATTARYMLPRLCESGLLHLDPAQSSTLGAQIVWDGDPPWRLVLGVAPLGTNRVEVSARLERGEGRIDLGEIRAIAAGGIAVLGDRLVRFEPAEHASWPRALLAREDRTIPLKDARKLIRALFDLENPPVIEVHEDLAPEERIGVPQPELRIDSAAAVDRVLGSIVFVYDGQEVALGATGRGWLDARNWSSTRRDLDAERSRAAEIAALGLAPDPATGRVGFDPSRIPELVRTLTASGWTVRAEDLRLRPQRAFGLSVRASGIDWFELEGNVEYAHPDEDPAAATTASLPRLLAAVELGRNTVLLDDGTLGLIPEQWLKARRALLAAGLKSGDTIRFSRSQAVLLDAILRAEESGAATDVDAAFARAREALRRGERPEAEEPGKGFDGTLRPYQKEGLGWMRHLLRLGLGGCLADDMGLGKTVQVLALLADLKAKRPILVVAPRSVVYNWIAEAARFTPKLRAVAYLGTGRKDRLAEVAKGGLLVTTYGTLRRDAALLDTRFHLVVLDEAQAIKNRETATARVARALQCEHRLALSGTPIENHFGEALSLFEFLNPGLLGAKARSAADSEDERPFVIRALRPFLLRRTKEKVATDLPARTEQTVLCEMEGEQKALYDELRDHYRDRVIAKVELEGMNRARFQVLEALLRLRQAACHPALIDKTRSRESSAKLETLVPRLQEVTEEGHKALVFSQFTSFLALLKPRLDELGLRYEYLDGKTRDREARVKRFQEDPDCPLFLISLKAGGLGLNLTAAEYVFLLDPWWNPAVEAQAVDRAHRIGQTRPVFAYRLLTKDSVEERVAELQASKRKLFDSLMAETASLRDLDIEDLRRLLG